MGPEMDGKEDEPSIFLSFISLLAAVEDCGPQRNEDEREYMPRLILLQDKMSQPPPERKEKDLGRLVRHLWRRD